MLYKYIPQYFFVTLLAVSSAAGLVWLDTFREYQATATILVVEKTPSGEVTETLAELSKNLSFYEAVLSQDDLLDDLLIGQTPDQRKAGWQRMVTVERKNNSDLLELTAWGTTQDRARLLAQSSLKTLFETASRYYNVKTELDVRIVDGPLISPGIRSYGFLIGVSILSGMAVTMFFFFCLALLDIRLKKKSLIPKSAGVAQSHATEAMFKPSVPVQWQGQEWGGMKALEETPAINEKIIVPKPEAASRAKAPANLPILDEEASSLSPLQGAMARLIKEDIDETARLHAIEPEEMEPAPATPRTEEPTQEEYRRRLNALLSGRID